MRSIAHIIIHCLNTADEFTYNTNSNTTKDLNKNITDIQYNLLNLPNKAQLSSSAAENYSHEANGHAVLYILIGGDHKGASHKPAGGQWVEGNKNFKGNDSQFPKRNY